MKWKNRARRRHALKPKRNGRASRKKRAEKKLVNLEVTTEAGYMGILEDDCSYRT